MTAAAVGTSTSVRAEGLNVSGLTVDYGNGAGL